MTNSRFRPSWKFRSLDEELNVITSLTPSPNELLEVACDYVHAGFSVIAIACDGSKQPARGQSWKQFQSRIASDAELQIMFRGNVGIAIVCGGISGNLETLDVDDPELVAPFEAAIEALAPGLLSRLPMVATPRGNGGGRHYRYRLVGPVGGSTKLAQSELRPQWNVDGTPQIDATTGEQRVAPETLIETRGEGAYAIAPGSPPSCHSSGIPYRHIAGPPLTEVPRISIEEHESLMLAARCFNRFVDEPIIEDVHAAPSRELTPGSDYNQRKSWEDLLTGAGWTAVGAFGELTFWRRPGKDRGHSATTGIRSTQGTELLCVFSTNAHPFEGATANRPCTSYSKFAVYALLHHGGDYAAAAKSLAVQGYGSTAAPGAKTHSKQGNTKRKSRFLPPYHPFPVDVFPEPVHGFILAGAQAVGCDPALIALPTLVALACAIGNARTIRLKRSWEEPAVIWAAIVGKSGTHKTPAMRVAIAPLERLQDLAFAKQEAEQERHQEELLRYERNLDSWKKTRNDDGPPPMKPPEPAPQRFIVSDATVEALTAILADQQDGVALIRDELAGWVDGMGEYKGGKGSDTSHWLSCWSAGPITNDRKTGPKKTLHVPRAAVSVTGGIQPAILARTLGREHLHDGLCARLLFAMPPSRTVRWTEAVIDEPIQTAVYNVYVRLAEMELAADAEGRPIPFALSLGAEAKRLWVEYFNRHREEMGGLDDDLCAASSKLEAYSARFALLFQLVKWAAGTGAEKVIEADCMAAAIVLSDWFGNEATRVYGLFGETDEDREHRRLAEWIERRGGHATARDVQMGCRWLRESGAAEAALVDLVSAGYGCWHVTQSGPRGGQPSRLFTLSTASTSTELDSSRQNGGSVDVDNADAFEGEVAEWTG